MSARRGPDRTTVVILLVAAAVAAGCVGIVVLSERATKRPSSPQIVGPMPEMTETNPPADLRLTVPEDVPVLGPPVPQDEKRQSARSRRLRERLEKQTLGTGRAACRWS